MTEKDTGATLLTDSSQQVKVHSGKIQSIRIGLIRQYLIALALAVASLSVNGLSARTIAIDQNFHGKISVSANCEFFEDKNVTLSLDQVKGEQFKANNTEALNLGLTSSALWMRFDVENGAAGEKPLLIQIDFPLIDHIHLYSVTETGAVSVQETGKMMPFGTREILNRNLILRINVPAVTRMHYFMRVQNEDTMQLPVWIWTPDEFYRHDHNEQIGLGIYFGIILVTVAYNFFLFISIRDRSYLLYVCYVSALGLFSFSQQGLAYEYLWPDHPLFAHRINPVLGSMMVALVCLFTDSFLNLKRNASKLSPIMRGLALLGVANACLASVASLTVSVRTLGAIALFAVVGLLLSGGLMYARGFRPARYYLFAFIALILAGGVYALKTLGALPSTFLTTNGLQMGSTVEVVLLSLGLGDRINTMRAEKEIAQENAKAREQELAKIALELDVARRIQRAILPMEAPVLPGLKVAARYLPMDSVGGDFYDFYRISDTILGILIADVSGHGIPAALIASMLKVAAAEQIGLASRPDQFLASVNRSILGKTKSEFITASFTLLDLEKGNFTCASAGHPPMLWYTGMDSVVREVRPTGRLLGVFPETRCGRLEHSISSGDRLVFTTDGVTESRNSSGLLFEEVIHDVVKRHASKGTEEFCDALLEEMRQWQLPIGVFDDDVTIVVADVK